MSLALVECVLVLKWDLSCAAGCKRIIHVAVTGQFIVQRAREGIQIDLLN